MYPFDDDDPTAQLYQPRTVPPLPPQETKDMLDRLGSGLSGGLGYIGDLLDKTFGGRAVRGLLGGNPREALSVLPMSDTLGITNYDDKVTGKQLLQNAAMISKEPKGPDEGFSMDDLLGIGGEMALDPAMYVGAAVPKLVFKGLNAGAKGIGQGLERTIGKNPYTAAQGIIGEGKRIGSSLFEKAAGGTWQTSNQALSREKYFPELTAGQTAAKTSYQDVVGSLDDIVKGANARTPGAEDTIKTAFMRGTTQAADPARAALASQTLAPHFTPDEIDQIIKHTQDYTQTSRLNTLAAGPDVGVLSKEAATLPDYARNAEKAAADSGLPRAFPGLTEEIYNPRVPKEARGKLDVQNQRKEALTGVSQFEVGREPVWTGWGGPDVINDILTNKHFAKDAPDMVAREQLSKMLTGHSANGANPWAAHPWGDQAWKDAQGQVDEFLRRMKSMSPDVRERGLFSEDVFGNWKARNLEDARVRASGNAVIEGLHPARGVIKPIADLQSAGTPYVRVPEFLNNAALTHIENGVPVAQQRVWEQLGLGPGHAGTLAQNLAGYGLPLDVANDMQRMGQAWKFPSSLTPVIDKWDQAVKAIKGNLTYPFPSFLSRNLLSGLFQQWRGSAMSGRALNDAQSMIRGGSVAEDTAKALYPHLSTADASKAIRNEMMANDVAFTRSGQYGERVGSDTSSIKGGYIPGELPEVGGATTRPMSQDVRDWWKRGPAPEDAEQSLIQSNQLIRKGTSAGNSAEDLLRGSHYLEKRLQGMNPAQAKLETMKYQIDYGDLAPFEQNVMKRLFPFYAFSRRNLPPILEDLANNPAKLAGSIRASTSKQDKDFLPEYLGESSAMKVGTADNGFTRYLSGFGLNYEDEALKAMGSALHGEGSRALQTTLGQIAPMFKFPLEQVFGTQMHTGRKLSDLRPNLAGQIAGGAASVLGESAPGLEQGVSELAAATPFSRFVTAAGKLADPRKDVGAKMLNLGTGFNLTDVDLPKQEQIAVRDKVMSQLTQDPLAKHWQEMYVKPEDIGKLTPHELEIYRFYKGLEQKAKQDAAKRKAQQPHE